MRIIAIVDGASLAVIGTECAAPTLSNEGAITLTSTVNAIQPKMIGTASTRIVRAMSGRVGASVQRAVATGHADFTRQEVCAWYLFSDSWSRTTPLTVIRQPMESPLPCAITFASTAVSVVTISNDQGSVTCIDALRLSLLIQIIDVRHRARCAENLEENVFRIELDDRIGVAAIRCVPA